MISIYTCYTFQFLITTIKSCTFFFFFNDTATTEIYTLSLHDALPICHRLRTRASRCAASPSSAGSMISNRRWPSPPSRSEEHTSELQSRLHLVCRLLLEKKKKKINIIDRYTPTYM